MVRGPAAASVAIIAENARLRRRVAASLSRDGVGPLAEYRTVGAFLAATDVPDDVVLCSERLSAKQIARLRRLKEHGAACVVVASSIRRSVLADAFAAGMDACVLEDDVDECLTLAIENARRGQASLPRELTTAIARPTLSVREKQTLALVVMGLSNAEIAQKLFVSESTVKSHLSSAFARLGVRTRNQATAMILDPDTGLGAGILTISGNERRRGRTSA